MYTSFSWCISFAASYLSSICLGFPPLWKVLAQIAFLLDRMHGPRAPSSSTFVTYGFTILFFSSRRPVFASSVFATTRPTSDMV